MEGDWPPVPFSGGRAVILGLEGWKTSGYSSQCGGTARQSHEILVCYSPVGICVTVGRGASSIHGSVLGAFSAQRAPLAFAAPPCAPRAGHVSSVGRSSSRMGGHKVLEMRVLSQSGQPQEQGPCLLCRSQTWPLVSSHPSCPFCACRVLRGPAEPGSWVSTQGSEQWASPTSVCHHPAAPGCPLCPQARAQCLHTPGKLLNPLPAQSFPYCL